MNHDYAHCLNFKETCPMDCFRAQLVRDLEVNPQRFTSWIHFRDSGECPLDDDDEEEEEEEDNG